MPEVELSIEGMTCAACVRRVERALQKTEGVTSATVNYASETALVQGTAPAEALQQAVEKAGYHAHLATEARSDESAPSRDWILALVLAIVVMAVSMAQHHRPYVVNLGLAVATAITTFWFGRSLFGSAIKSLKAGTSTMDTLVSAGASITFLYSAWAMIRWRDNPHELADHLYFETAAVIVALVLFGRSLETRTRRRMAGEMKSLLTLAPERATRVLPNGVEEKVALTEIREGDFLRVFPGERIPVDGQIAEGSATLDESMWTGEPLYVQKHAGETVWAGSLNQTGSFDFRATGVGRKTRLAQIAQLISHAQGSKAPIQQLADRVAAIFVPVVFLLAAGTFLFHLLVLKSSAELAMIPAVAVLVIACPCALGLATPTAILAGVTLLARRGILAREGSVFELAAPIQTVLFDKTGTLTEGKFEVRMLVLPGGEALPFEAGSPPDWLQQAASLERRSEHPIATAFVNLPSAQEEVEQFRAIPGQGVIGLLAGTQIEVGKPNPKELALAGDTSGLTPVAVRRNSELAGLVLLGDQIRDGLAFTSSGMRRVLVSGDQRPAVQAVATALKLDGYHAQVTPEQKVAIVKEEQGRGRVAFVGDGINDSAAMAVADVAIAMGTGSDLSKQTAHFILIHSNPQLAETAIRLSRKVLTTMRVNLIWAFGYNVLMIPLAMAGKLNPMIAAVAMALSSLSVVGNSVSLLIRNRG